MISERVVEIGCITKTYEYGKCSSYPFRVFSIE